MSLPLSIATDGYLGIPTGGGGGTTIVEGLILQFDNDKYTATTTDVTYTITYASETPSITVEVNNSNSFEIIVDDSDVLFIREC